MTAIRIAVIDPTKTEKVNMEVPDDVPVKDLLEAMIDTLKYPVIGARGRHLRYQLYVQRSNGQQELLEERDTLAQNAIDDGADLQIYQDQEMIAGCFPAGTRVTIPKNRYKPIEEVKVGERLLSYSVTNYIPVSSQVTEIYKGRESRYFIINDLLKVTPSHLIYANESWKPVEKLQPGDILLNDKFENTVVKSIVPVDEELDVYNLNLSDSAPFFADGLLVHNLQSKQDDKQNQLSSQSNNRFIEKKQNDDIQNLLHSQPDYRFIETKQNDDNQINDQVDDEGNNEKDFLGVDENRSDEGNVGKSSSKPTILFSEINQRLRIINDLTTGFDRLNYSRYASAFADLVTNPEMSTPVTLGIFGEWGSGKSFLMGKIKEEILAQQKKNKNTEIDIHILDFNAWVYSGSEHLWASLVTHLYREIEKYFGWKAHWMRLGKAIRKSLPKALGVFAFYGILGLGLSFLLNFNKIQSTANGLAVAFANAVIGTLIGGSALASLPALWVALKEFFDSLFLSRASKLQNVAARPDFSSQIGIMADIKDEIRFIRELLKAGKYGKPTRLVLFIDDLDRCEHRKAVEVLQAIMLLLADDDGSPFFIFLGIDARVIVRAIEEHYGEVLVKAGINGYEYLDKIIQVPFVIPPASQTDIDNYVDSLLWASDDEKKLVLVKMAPPSRETEKSASVEETQGEILEPQLPTDAALFEARKEMTGRAKAPALEEVPVTFTQAEREALKACTVDLNGNPRKIKRIINIYRLARLIMPQSIERAKAVRWILMTEQWPLHVAWVIEHIENDVQAKNKYAEKMLTDVYQVARKDIYAETMEALLGIDADPNLFEHFIKKEPVFSVQEIKTLLPLTFNLNPAIRSEVSKQALKLAEVNLQPKKKAASARASSRAEKSAQKNATTQQIT